VSRDNEIAHERVRAYQTKFLLELRYRRDPDRWSCRPRSARLTLAADTAGREVTCLSEGVSSYPAANR